jgi:hypothetical protein
MRDGRFEVRQDARCQRCTFHHSNLIADGTLANFATAGIRSKTNYAIDPRILAPRSPSLTMKCRSSRPSATRELTRRFLGKAFATSQRSSSIVPARAPSVNRALNSFSVGRQAFRSAAFAPLRARRLKTDVCTLPHQRALELRQSPKNMKSERTHTSCRSYRSANAGVCPWPQASSQSRSAVYRPRQAIEFPGHEHIALAHLFERDIQLWTIDFAVRGRLLENLLAAGALQSLASQRAVLIKARNTNIANQRRSKPVSLILF